MLTPMWKWDLDQRSPCRVPVSCPQGSSGQVTLMLYLFKNPLPCGRLWFSHTPGGGEMMEVGRSHRYPGSGSAGDQTVAPLQLFLVPARAVASPRCWPLAELG